MPFRKSFSLKRAIEDGFTGEKCRTDKQFEVENGTANPRGGYLTT